MSDFITALKSIVNRHGNDAAIIDRGVVFSYKQLWQDAMSFAAFLQDQEIGPEDVVGLHLDKSKNYVTGMIGCWMAGAAFMPLHPALPKDRRDSMIAEAQVRYIYTGGVFPEQAMQPVTLQPHPLAYVIYTSGSTGRPKGVMVEHAGLVPMLQDQIAAFGLQPGKRSLFYLSIAFDASLSDIGTALLSGATLVIEDDAVLKDASAFIKALKARGITHIDCPPSLLKILDRDAMPYHLETIIIGGEVCPPDVVRHWAQKYNIVNVYGPTEATICVSLCRCDDGWTQPLIGRPISDVVFHVIDDELHIESKGLARGYINQPELTAQKFIRVGDKRLYKTGDDVRLQDNGDVVFLGRVDRQFKLRGQLIAPEEIEAALLQDPDIMQASVLKRPLHEGMTHHSLVAFVKGELSVDWRDRLACRLPDWMLPDHVEILSDIPVTASGKPDFSCLASLPLTKSNKAEDMSQWTVMQKKLWQVWRKILKHDQFGIDDHFLKIGGDSLGVMSLLLEAEKSGLRFSPGLLMLHPTIRSLASALDARAISHHDGMPVAALLEAAALDYRWNDLIEKARARPARKSGKVSAVLVTGATGSLGGRIAGELFDQGVERIYCLIRAEDDPSAQRRLYARLGMEDPRIIAVRGDVSQRCFGLAPDEWRSLCNGVDAVYHCAATVNLVASFEDLASANLEGTKEVLRFALTGNRKHLHYASTLSVFVATDQNSGRVFETDKLNQTKIVYGGYAQTKWAAEKMLLSVPADAVDISCYRFGLITGDSRTGMTAPHDFLSLFVQGLESLGVIPPLEMLRHLAVDVTPVDFAVQSMLRLASEKPAGIYHLANRDSLYLDRFIRLLREADIVLREVSIHEWRTLPQTRSLTSAETSAWLSMCRVLLPEEFARLRSMDLFQATDITFDMSLSGFSCPAPADALISSYIRHIRAGATRRVCILGPESTGKSTLARKLAERTGACSVPEFAEIYLRAKNGDITPEDIPIIAAGQVNLEETADQHGNVMLICDSNLMTTMIWSEHLFGCCPAWLRAEAVSRDYDLYLLCDIDVPFVDDVHRYAPDQRATFLKRFEEVLAKAGRPYIKISGNWERREEAALAAIRGIA